METLIRDFRHNYDIFPISYRVPQTPKAYGCWVSLIKVDQTLFFFTASKLVLANNALSEHSLSPYPSTLLYEASPVLVLCTSKPGCRAFILINECDGVVLSVTCGRASRCACPLQDPCWARWCRPLFQIRKWLIGRG